MEVQRPSLRPGDRLAGRYEIVEEVGAGGMGTVYRAIDATSGAAVAVKIVRIGDPTDERRFEREAAALGCVSHPAIVRYLDHGVAQGVPYLVMDWLAGRTLDEHLADVGITPAESVALARRIADGLAAVHARGLVHRDIKPENLLLVDGDLARVTILDFGVARPTVMFDLITHTGRAVGTPGYMSPEQTRGERGLDARSDIFSLGCVLYECLTGRAPFPGEHATAVCAKILLQDPTPLATQWPDAPPALHALVDACLSKDTRRRPADGGELVRRLAALPPVDPALPRRSRFRASPTLPAHRPRDREPLVSIVMALPATRITPPGVFDVARRLGGRTDVLGDGSVIVELTGGTARVHADAVTALAAAFGSRVIAIATGPAAPDARADVVERVARVYEAEAIAAALPGRTAAPPPGAVRADAATIALLAPPLAAWHGRASYLLTQPQAKSACAPDAR